MICPLCGRRAARRACPALGHQICAVCCGTKRLTQIQCPSDCAYLASAREHPPAAVVRQQQRDFAQLLQSMRDLNRRQSELFLITINLVARYQSPDLPPLLDDDVVEASAALAATYETATRGVIYEHRPASLLAERLVAAMTRLLTEVRQQMGAGFERDAAIVLRRIEETARDVRAQEPANRRALLELLDRLARLKDSPAKAGTPTPEPSRLIVP